MYEAFYQRVVRDQPEDAVLRINDLLQLPGAAEAYAAHRRRAVDEVAGFEVG